MTLLSVQNFTVKLRGRTIFQDVSFEVGMGEVIGLIGPNGAGKTTLMRAALGLVPSSGHSSLATCTPQMRARQAAWMPQSREIAWPVSVETVVMLGRIPHLATGRAPKDEDRRKTDAAIKVMNLTALRHRTATRLSGGEQARVLIARALAQDTPLLMADEPIAGLDPAHQIATMQTFQDLAACGKSVIVSLHDLGLAVRHCTRLILLGQGRLVADGPPDQVLTPERLDQVFGISAAFQHGPDGPIFQPLAVTR